MREKLNENPIAQLGLIGLLLVVGVFVFLKPGGGGAESAEAPAGEVTATVNGATATGSTPGEAVEGAVQSLEEGGGVSPGAGVATGVPPPPPPRPVTTAYDAGRTVVLLVVHDGGIDDALVRGATEGLNSVPDTALFVVPAKQVARYAAITLGLDLSQVPALVVMRPKQLSHGVPQATVDYGFQTPQSVVQAVIDAGYKGPEEAYHPE